MRRIAWDASRPEKNLQISLAAALPEDIPMQFRRPSEARSIRMTRICVAGLLAAAGATASAQPVARQLIDDADVVEVLHTEQSVGTVANCGSMHVLEDLDGDGVREVLLTHAKQAASGSILAEFFRAEVRSFGSGQVLFTLPPDEAEALKLAHCAAVMIEDIDGDGVRDIAVGRAVGIGVGLRVHSGASGEVIRAPFFDDIRFQWGMSMLPWEDFDGDGQADLLLSRRASHLGGEPFIVWSPGSGATDSFRPEGHTGVPSDFVVGYSLLDLGIGATGSRELLSTESIESGYPFIPSARVSFFGRDPFAFVGAFDSNDVDGPVVFPAAGILGDLTGDGFNEIVVGWFGGTPNGPVAVLSGALPSAPNNPYFDPIATQSPEIITDVGNGPEVFRLPPTDALIVLDDATGDGFPDYAYLYGLFPSSIPNSGWVVAVCGRTGRAFFAAAQNAPLEGSGRVSWVRPTTGLRSGRNALVSPGDINNDGAPDLFVLVVREDYTTSPHTREQLLLTHYLPTPCVGDVDFDRVVNFADLNTVLSNFGAADITLPADLNADGVVNFADLNLVLSAFGAQCD
jgi:hypothetical protein